MIYVVIGGGLSLCTRYRHVADKLQKSENVMEKYKKKLQEGADLRQQLRVCGSFSSHGRYTEGVNF